MSNQLLASAYTCVIVPDRPNQTTKQISTFTDPYISASSELINEIDTEKPKPNCGPLIEGEIDEPQSPALHTDAQQFVTVDAKLLKDVFGDREKHKVFSEVDGRPDLLTWAYEDGPELAGPYTGLEMDELFAQYQINPLTVIKRFGDEKRCTVGDIVKKYVKTLILANKSQFKHLIRSPPTRMKSVTPKFADDDAISVPQKPGRRDSRIVSEPVRPCLFFLDAAEHLHDGDSDDEPKPTRVRSRPLTR